jgi:hypothetical protein
VVEGLAFNHTCLALDLSKNGIAAAGMAQLAEVLPGCKLQTLSLSTNNLCDEGAETLAKVLSGEWGARAGCVQRSGDFRAAALRCQRGRQAAGRLCSGQAVQRAGCAAGMLETLTKRCAPHHNASGQSPPTAAHATRHLQHHASTRRATHMPPAPLPGNENIYSLNLANNGIGNRGAAALAEALKLNTHLARLDLSGNNIDKEGAAALAEALAVNTSLEALYINENYLGGWGGWVGGGGGGVVMTRVFSKALLSGRGLGGGGGGWGRRLGGGGVCV